MKTTRSLLLLLTMMLAPFAGAQGTDTCDAPTPIGTFDSFPFDSSSATHSGFFGSVVTCSQVGAFQIRRDLFWVWRQQHPGQQRSGR